MTMRFVDRAEVGGTRTTDDGYLVATAAVARAGVQYYLPREVGLDGDDLVAVYRPEDEVRAPESVRTFSHAPVTLDHPAEQVTADNWKALAKGEATTDVEWRDNRLHIPLILKDADTIQAVKDGTRELSPGYTCELDFTDGTAPDGTAYQAVQRNIRINHIAIVPRGRSGPEVRIGDGAGEWGAAPVSPQKDMDMTMKTVVVGDKAVQVAATDAPTLEVALKTMADGHTAAMDKAAADHQTAIEAKDTEIGELKAKLADTEKKVLTDEQLRDAVKARGEIERVAKAVSKDINLTLPDAALRKAAVTAHFGDAAVEGASDAEVAGMFKALRTAKADALADSFRSAPAREVKDTANAWADFVPKKEA